MNFWDVMREISAEPIRQEARRIFVLALAGDPEAVATAREAVLGKEPSAELLASVAPYLYTCSPPYTEQDEKWLRHADLIASLSGGPGITDFRPADTLAVENPGEVLQKVLGHRSDLRVALGRRLPGFRKSAADALVKDVSRANTEFAVVAGVSKFLPHLLPFFPLLSVADTFILTKNQVFMLFRLAAIYGEEPNLKERAMETVPIIGSAFGWRQVARMAAGAIPGPWGLPVKAAVAFSGTYAVGRAAEVYFEQDRRPTADEMKRFFDEGKRLGTDWAAKVLRKKAKPEEPPARAVVEEHPAALSEGVVGEFATPADESDPNENPTEAAP